MATKIRKINFSEALYPGSVEPEGLKIALCLKSDKYKMLTEFRKIKNVSEALYPKE